MEREGEKYYTEQAQLNKNNAVKEVCLILAKEERIHAQILKNKADKRVYELPGSDSYAKIKNLFKDMENFNSEINETPTQLEFYKGRGQLWTAPCLFIMTLLNLQCFR